MSSIIQQTKATLTVKIVERKDPRFWQRRIQKVAIVLSMKNLIPHLTDVKVVMERDWWSGKWYITKDLHQWNNEHVGVWEKTYPEIKHTDEEFRKLFLSTLGNNKADGEELTPERTIARLIGGIVPWKKATWKELNILK